MDLRGARDLGGARLTVPDETELRGMAEIAQLVYREQAGDTFTIQVGPYTLFAVIGGLQLALRHPSLGSQIRQTIHDALGGLIPLYQGNGAVTALLERGFQPEHDR